MVGTTRYFNVEPQHRRVEIGHTWYATRAQRTAVNTECKLLLLAHASLEFVRYPSREIRHLLPQN